MNPASHESEILNAIILSGAKINTPSKKVAVFHPFPGLGWTRCTAETSRLPFNIRNSIYQRQVLLTKVANRSRDVKNARVTTGIQHEHSYNESAGESGPIVFGGFD